jgi:hypothetical protein
MKTSFTVIVTIDNSELNLSRPDSTMEADYAMASFCRIKNQTDCNVSGNKFHFSVASGPREVDCG